MRRAAGFRAAIATGLLATLAACASGGSTSSQLAVGGRLPTPVDQVQIIEGDVTDRPYKSLVEVSVKVDKVRNLTFTFEPTRAIVDQRLKEEASKLGADAVIQVQYRNVGVRATSWGSVVGTGRA